MSDSDRPLRIFVFPERPDCLLVCVPDTTGRVALPELSAPFTKYDVAKACGDARVLARVGEMTPGRWTPTMQRAAVEARAERAQQNRLREASEAALLRGSAAAEVKERGEAIVRKHQIDEQIRDLKAKIGKAKSVAATSGKFLTVSAFRGMEQQLETLKQESQAIQVRLGELRKAEKDANRRIGKSEDQRFREAARRMLDAETFEELTAIASEDGEDAEVAA